MKKILVILAGSVILLLLFIGLLRVKNIEEGYEGKSRHGTGHMGGNIGNIRPIHGPRPHEHRVYNGYYPVYGHYEYPIYYVNDNDDYIFDENGILYYISNPILFWRKIWGY
jgi:hypothetical protein